MLHNITTKTDTYPTGEACPDCGAKQYFVPGYLVTTTSGGKAFTAARETNHNADNCGGTI